jgi:hypothetical protein
VIGNRLARLDHVAIAREKMRPGKGPLGGPETGVDGYAAAKPRAQRPGQSDRISFDKEIQIRDWATQDRIAERPADDVDGHPKCRSLLRDRAQKIECARRQPLSQKLSEIGMHLVILTDEIVYNAVHVSEPAAVPAWLNPYLVWIGLVLRIQRGSRTR